jgi:hypothetical protein
MRGDFEMHRIYDRFLARMCARRDNLKRWIDAMESGYRLKKRCGSDWVDLGPDFLDECKEELADTEEHIALFERHNETVH